MKTSSPTGLSLLVICFLAVSIPIETAYSWQPGLTGPYYSVKVVGWALLACGAFLLRGPGAERGLVFLAAGWGWMGANFSRAVADRMARITAGRTLRLGSVELWFATGCLLLSLIGLTWSLVMTRRLTARS
jgi:hypothetical protein